MGLQKVSIDSYSSAEQAELMGILFAQFMEDSFERPLTAEDFSAVLYDESKGLRLVFGFMNYEMPHHSLIISSDFLVEQLLVTTEHKDDFGAMVEVRFIPPEESKTWLEDKAAEGWNITRSAA
ncbi:hypothetical protein M2113_000611 [Aurantimicrobium minutum]|uniref:hypothetical protein n=1 Tax=Aurantimicrobium minutum TaxID=708131 RepID=UPI002476D0AD|nr:hypothetical protein [Aurantimicrobium minutum]MDH6409650.1 hypothetical protein [Aurantimicrobium minutum]